MRTHTLTVIGEPLLCGTSGCEEPATVLLRQVYDNGDDESQQLYCDACWLSMRRAYMPIVARDEQEAVRAADALVTATDGRKSA